MMSSKLINEHLSCFIGWILLLLSAWIPGFSDGKFLTDQSLAAFFYTALLVVFFVLIVPRLGSPYELCGVLSILIFSLSVFLILNHVLAHRSEGLIVWVYNQIQGGIKEIVTLGAGAPIAEIVSKPLYLFSGVTVLAAFASRRFEWLILIYGVVLFSGLFPFSLAHLLAYLLWFAGFYLIRETPLHLPLSLMGKINFNQSTRDFLLEVRAHPLTEAQTIWFLSGSTNVNNPPPHCIEKLKQLSAAGLVEYDSATHLVTASSKLEATKLIQGTEKGLQLSSIIAQLVLFGAAAIYLLSPLDLLPESLLGPIGFLDDSIIIAATVMPLVPNISNFKSLFLSRGRHIKTLK